MTTTHTPIDAYVAASLLSLVMPLCSRLPRTWVGSPGLVSCQARSSATRRGRGLAKALGGLEMISRGWHSGVVFGLSAAASSQEAATDWTLQDSRTFLGWPPPSRVA
jgi:hypothetical protein